MALPIFGGTITLTDNARGWVTPNPAPSPGGGTVGLAAPNNGTAANNSYMAGLSLGLGQFRDWFEFSVPSFEGTVVSATLALDQPAGIAVSGAQPVNAGHEGPPNLYTLYALPAIPTGFADFLAGSNLGSATLDSGSNGTTVDINLDASALAAIGAVSGGTFVLGGIDSGEVLPAMCNLCGQDFDFANTSDAAVTLTLDVDPGPAHDKAPEPSTLVIGIFAAAGLRLARGAMRRLRNQ